MPKISRQTIGNKIDLLILELITNILKAAYAPKAEKLHVIREASAILDTTKLLLKVSWKAKAVDNKRYLSISEKLDELGKMLGGWQKSFR